MTGAAAGLHVKAPHLPHPEMPKLTVANGEHWALDALRAIHWVDAAAVAGAEGLAHGHGAGDLDGLVIVGLCLGLWLIFKPNRT
jgi:hypothetical protein